MAGAAGERLEYGEEHALATMQFLRVNMVLNAATKTPTSEPSTIRPEMGRRVGVACSFLFSPRMPRPIIGACSAHSEARRCSLR